jgi:putative transport protein
MSDPHHAGGLTIGLGLPVGVLLASFVIGWLHSTRPLFARVPELVIWLLDSLGLNGFLAAVGINAGPSFVRGLRSTGVELLATGVIVCAVPYLLTILAGRYIFRVHPGILLGMCAGSGTSSPGLAAVQEKAESRVPVLGYGVSYAISALVLAIVGEVSIGSPTANALPNLLLPGQYHSQDNDGYADPQLECVLET